MIHIGSDSLHSSHCEGIFAGQDFEILRYQSTVFVAIVFGMAERAYAHIT